MKCNQFESVCCDLARDQLIDVRLGEEVIAHTKVCAKCESGLAEQQAISDGLRALAMRYEGIEPPREIEVRLVEAFRRLNQDAIPDERSLSRSPRQIQPNTIIKYIAAALILLVLGLAIWLKENKSSVEEITDRAAIKQTQPPSVPQQVEKEPSDQSPGDDKAIVAQSTTLAFESNRVKSQNTRSRAKHVKTRADTANSTKTEIATDFIPLVDFENISEMDSGRLLRVQLPRSTLLSFGLPVNVARADEPVMADVLVGDDGLARAIRFVR